MPGNTPNKYSYIGESLYQRGGGTPIIFFGKVVDTTDEFDGNRVKARIKGVDDHVADSDLAFCFPVIPKFLNVVPKKGETIMIMVPNPSNLFENRLYFGPIISQPQKLEMDPHFYSSRSLMDGGFIGPEETPSKNPEAIGVYPKKHEIAIQGRKNTDIRLRDSEVLIRAGKHVTNQKLNFNREDPAYIQIKHNVNVEPREGDQPAKKGSVTNIVASKINLITHENGRPRFKVTDQEENIVDTELERILDEAHPVPYGDVVEEFFALVKEFVQSHVHPYHGDAPDQTKNVEDILNFDLNRVSSKNIKIN